MIRHWPWGYNHEVTAKHPQKGNYPSPLNNHKQSGLLAHDANPYQEIFNSTICFLEIYGGFTELWHWSWGYNEIITTHQEKGNYPCPLNNQKQSCLLAHDANPYQEIFNSTICFKRSMETQRTLTLAMRLAWGNCQTPTKRELPTSTEQSKTKLSTCSLCKSLDTELWHWQWGYHEVISHQPPTNRELP